MKRIYTIAIGLCCLAGQVKAQEKADAAELEKDADALLSYGPVSVMQKTALPPSGDKHDYMSLAPYWWPDPSKPGGLPYIRKDGDINPEVKNYPDKNNMPVLCENIYKLSLAYHFSGKEAYARHAVLLIKAWFLDTATRMNPNLNYGQAVKGVTDGRAEGLIDSRCFIYLIEGIRLLDMTKQDKDGLKTWFSAFLTWMQTSTIGLDEQNAKNNHGVWYDAQSLSIALFVDSTDLAHRIIARAADRLDKQMNDDGLFPLELERTTSLHYSVFALNAFFIIADLSSKTGTDFWTLTTPSGKSLGKAFNALLPYLSGEKTWTWKEIHPFNPADAVPLLMRGAEHYNCTSCEAIIQKTAPHGYNRLLIHIL